MSPDKVKEKVKDLPEDEPKSPPKEDITESKWPPVIYGADNPDIINPQIAKKMVQGIDSVDAAILMLLTMAHTRDKIRTDGVIDPKKVEWLLKAKIGSTKRRVERLCFIGAIVKKDDTMIQNTQLQPLVARRARR